MKVRYDHKLNCWVVELAAGVVACFASLESTRNWLDWLENDNRKEDRESEEN